MTRELGDHLPCAFDAEERIDSTAARVAAEDLTKLGRARRLTLLYRRRGARGDSLERISHRGRVNLEPLRVSSDPGAELLLVNRDRGRPEPEPQPDPRGEMRGPLLERRPTPKQPYMPHATCHMTHDTCR